MKDKERREVRNLLLQEIRVLRQEGELPKIRGYAAIFDVMSEVLWGFREIIRPGAFTETLKTADVRALWQHQAAMPLGRKKNNTLEIAEDDRGLHITITPPETQWGRDAVASIERGDVDQMSFGFETINDKWSKDENGFPLRELLEVNLFEVSPVTFPAYPDTTVAVRSMEAAGLGEPSAQEDEAALPEPWRKAYREREIQIGGAIL
jgi:HK97 family phage prohead protease